MLSLFHYLLKSKELLLKAVSNSGLIETSETKCSQNGGLVIHRKPFMAILLDHGIRMLTSWLACIGLLKVT